MSQRRNFTQAGFPLYKKPPRHNGKMRRLQRPRITPDLLEALGREFPTIKRIRHEFVVSHNAGETEISVQEIRDWNIILYYLERTLEFGNAREKKKTQEKTEAIPQQFMKKRN